MILEYIHLKVLCISWTTCWTWGVLCEICVLWPHSLMMAKMHAAHSVSVQPFPFSLCADSLSSVFCFHLLSQTPPPYSVWISTGSLFNPRSTPAFSNATALIKMLHKQRFFFCLCVRPIPHFHHSLLLIFKKCSVVIWELLWLLLSGSGDKSERFGPGE